MNVVITCGGTGGHVTPALAIADVLRANLPRAEITFIGTEGGMENALVTAAGYRIRPLPVRGVSRRHPTDALRALKLLRAATAQAGGMLDELAPDIVIGTGSYACYPALAAAAMRKIPAAVHESNAVPGLAVRLLAARLSRVWLGFEAAAGHLPRHARTLVVGNPLPRDFYVCGGGDITKDRPKTVLSFGGSLGARAINNGVLDLMLSMRAYADVRFVHATGKREWEEFSARFAATALAGDARFEVVPFITDMARRMREADVVIARAGAMTLSELAATGRAAVLVPSPNVTGNHQLKNAREMALAGAALVVEEKELLRGGLARAVGHLLHDDAARTDMQAAIARHHRPDAARLIFEDILSLSHKKS
ncbi:MAG: UDP-N-acetylglucosamine--N-acetylmuramyl-(pentapeptide) pyrophosphoryl-undecaprenol N-acetylglucosamine transferase [Ruminococcaceae bacterium]|nr:UDP-N-acetylglucosamine--N-acetylmuramyl-(pentapeptide) pyrophosphoryl-undecaprenol N-acetylglucosamine transferase [Oscillospiraceae bacterium]